MKKVKEILQGKVGTILLFAMAGVMFASSAIGTTRAALTYYSEDYTMQMEIQDIGVTLVEKSASGTKDISSRDYSGGGGNWNQTEGKLLADMLNESNGKLAIGRKYTEELSVRNTGTIDQYVRVTIMKYWTDENGKKRTDLAPSLIVLNLTGNGWIQDNSASSEERTVLYWPYPLSVGSSTAAFSNSIYIDGAINSKIVKTSQTTNGLTTITTSSPYEGAKFNLEVEVDAVQTHNAADAIKSAWGVNVNVGSNGNLSLAQ